MQISAQSSEPHDFGASYKVKKGDTQTFQYTKLLVNGLPTTIPLSIQLQNGSSTFVNITQGTKFDVKVIDVNVSTIYQYFPNGSYLPVKAQTAFIQEIYHAKNNEYPTQVTTSLIYLMQGFDNESSVDAFINYVGTNNSAGTASVNSKYIYESSKTNYTNIIIYDSFIYEWSSGWMQQFNAKEYSNSKLLLDLEVKNTLYNPGGNNLLTGLPNYESFAFYSLLIGLPIAIIVLFSYTWLNYKRYSTKSLNRLSSHTSFSQYVKSNLKRKNKHQKTQKPEIDKSLSIIEEILNESN